MKIEKNAKKVIFQEWSSEFPELSSFSKSKLFKLLGPLVGGIEFFDLKKTVEYRPYVAWYPIWKSTLKECLNQPLVLYEIRNKKGLQFDIPYNVGDTVLNEAIDATRQQMFLSLEGDVKVNEIFSLIDRQFSKTLIKSSPIGQANLLEGKLLIALYLNDQKSIQMTMNEIKEKSDLWMSGLFEWKNGRTDIWIEKLKGIVLNREQFLSQVYSNRQDKSLLSLKSSEILI